MSPLTERSQGANFPQLDTVQHPVLTHSKIKSPALPPYLPCHITQHLIHHRPLAVVQVAEPVLDATYYTSSEATFARISHEDGLYIHLSVAKDPRYVSQPTRPTNLLERPSLKDQRGQQHVQHLHQHLPWILIATSFSNIQQHPHSGIPHPRPPPPLGPAPKVTCAARAHKPHKHNPSPKT